MLKLKKIQSVTAVFLLTLGAFSFAHDGHEHVSMEELIQERQMGFKYMGRDLKTLRVELKKDAPDFAEMQSAAESIQSQAAKVASWFPVGSGEEAGVKTDALPYIWKNPDKFSQLSAELNQAAQAATLAAAAKDTEASKQQLKAIKSACSACHRSYRAD